MILNNRNTKIVLNNSKAIILQEYNKQFGSRRKRIATFDSEIHKYH